jgi:hypothetical protein
MTEAFRALECYGGFGRSLEGQHMRTFLAGILLVLAACGTNASGPRFGELHEPPVSAGQVRVYIFRGKATYLAQAPSVVRAQIEIDGRPIGGLENGGFLTADLSAGPHTIAAVSGSDSTVKSFQATGRGDVYVEVWDKTRMEGAAPLAAGLVGGAAGGAIVGAVQGASREDSEGRVWGINFVTADDALPVLRGLALSE